MLFLSYASNLVSGDTNRTADVFLRYRPNGTTQRVSVSNNEAQGNGASWGTVFPFPANGRYVAMHQRRRTWSLATQMQSMCSCGTGLPARRNVSR